MTRTRLASTSTLAILSALAAMVVSPAAWADNDDERPRNERADKHNNRPDKRDWDARERGAPQRKDSNAGGDAPQMPQVQTERNVQPWAGRNAPSMSERNQREAERNARIGVVPGTAAQTAPVVRQTPEDQPVTMRPGFTNNSGFSTPRAAPPAPAWQPPDRDDNGRNNGRDNGRNNARDNGRDEHRDEWRVSRNTDRRVDGPDFHNDSRDNNRFDNRSRNDGYRVDNRDRHDNDRWRAAPAPRVHIDRTVVVERRVNIDHHYPTHGHVVPVLPRDYRRIPWRGTDYFVHGGVWYRPYGRSYVVVRPPFGFTVSVLPPFYTTFWFGGIPYYYANGIYYNWRPVQREYVVVEPPPEDNLEDEPWNEELYAYPTAGQSEAQQADDRYACHRWAVSQTDFDPTQPPANLDRASYADRYEDYQRASTACLTARGYTVR